VGCRHADPQIKPNSDTQWMGSSRIASVAIRTAESDSAIDRWIQEDRFNYGSDSGDDEGGP
jgi:hypothetical protein